MDILDRLNVRNFRIVLGCTLPHTVIFAQFTNVWTIVMREDPLLHNGIRDLGISTNQIDFQQHGLQVSMFRRIVLQGFQQKRRRFLNLIAAQENFRYSLNVNERAATAFTNALAKSKAPCGFRSTNKYCFNMLR